MNPARDQVYALLNLLIEQGKPIVQGSADAVVVETLLNHLEEAAVHRACEAERMRDGDCNSCMGCATRRAMLAQMDPYERVGDRLAHKVTGVTVTV